PETIQVPQSVSRILHRVTPPLSQAQQTHAHVVAGTLRIQMDATSAASRSRASKCRPRFISPTPPLRPLPPHLPVRLGNCRVTCHLHQALSTTSRRVLSADMPVNSGPQQHYVRNPR